MATELSVREAAELTGYNPDHIYRLLESGKVRGRKVVTVWLVDRDSILAYLERMKDDPRGGPKKKKTA